MGGDKATILEEKAVRATSQANRAMVDRATILVDKKVDKATILEEKVDKATTQEDKAMVDRAIILVDKEGYYPGGQGDGGQGYYPGGQGFSPDALGGQGYNPGISRTKIGLSQDLLKDEADPEEDLGL